jgi:hypothetical protein
LELRPGSRRRERSAIIHVLTDGFADRVLGFGLLHPAAKDGKFTFVLPQSSDEEWQDFCELVAGLPPRTVLLHFGDSLRRWHEEHAFTREADPSMESRFIDLQKRLRAAAIYPAPVGLLDDFVRHGIGGDPLRSGHAGAAAMWALEDDGASQLQNKLHQDLLDMAALKLEILDADVPTEASDVEEQQAQA